MKIRGLFDALSIGGIVLLAACGGMQSPISVPGTRSSAAGNFQNHHTFLYTGAAQSFVVPANTTLIKVVARGAGAGPKAYSRREPARGARVSALLPVRPGERLRVYVGGAGYSDESGNYSGGFNGGGNPGDRFGGLGGGGASDVREGGDALGFRILVAGGGGGSCGFHGGGLGGHGGGRAGGSGESGTYSDGSGGGGGGGTQTHGGAGGKREWVTAAKPAAKTDTSASAGMVVRQVSDIRAVPLAGSAGGRRRLLRRRRWWWRWWRLLLRRRSGRRRRWWVVLRRANCESCPHAARLEKCDRQRARRY